MSRAHLQRSLTAVYPFDARGAARRFRHAATFGALDALQPGETTRFVDDHDPLPLLDPLGACYGWRIRIECRQRDAGAIAIDFAVCCTGPDEAASPRNLPLRPTCSRFARLPTTR
jgi:hypothetical protein